MWRTPGDGRSRWRGADAAARPREATSFSPFATRKSLIDRPTHTHIHSTQIHTRKRTSTHKHYPSHSNRLSLRAVLFLPLLLLEFDLTCWKCCDEIEHARWDRERKRDREELGRERARERACARARERDFYPYCPRCPSNFIPKTPSQQGPTPRFLPAVFSKVLYTVVVVFKRLSSPPRRQKTNSSRTHKEPAAYIERLQHDKKPKRTAKEGRTVRHAVCFVFVAAAAKEQHKERSQQ